MRADGILYISYDGMLEPLGQSQVLSYLEKLATNHRICLLSFEKATDWDDHARRSEIERRIETAGIRWYPRRFHRGAIWSAKLYDLAAGAFTSWRITRRDGIGVIHARSYVPGLMALLVKAVSRVRFLFDMRGFWADERVDGGLWPRNGRTYRVAKRLEKQLLLRADHIVSLTAAGVRQLERFDYLQGRTLPVSVIPTCVDLARFRPQPNRESGLVFGYVGTVGTWYVFEAFVTCFARLRLMRPEARLLILNRGEHEYIRDALRRGGVPDSVVELRTADPSEVPDQMARMHATAFFIKPVFSKLASAPTKLGEFLGCGIPCLANAGVGDVAEVLLQERVGVVVDGVDGDAIDRGLRDLLALVDDPEIALRCSQAARRRFSLEDGVQRYAEIYRQLGIVTP